MKIIGGCITAILMFGLAEMALATPTDTAIEGSLSKAENTCVSPVEFFQFTHFQLCSYSGGVDIQSVVTNTPSLDFHNWMGPMASGGFYPKGFLQSPATEGGFSGAVIGDGKVNLPFSGTLTIEDNQTPANGVDDSISGTFIFGPGERAVFTSNGNAVERFDGITHTLPSRLVSSATANAMGGFDYVIGSAGFPQLISSAAGVFPSETASILTDSPVPPDFNAWDVVNGGDIPLPAYQAPPLGGFLPHSVEIVSYAPGAANNSNVEPNIGLATTAVVANLVCESGDADSTPNMTNPNPPDLPQPIDDCNPDPAIGAGATWAVSGAEFDNLILKLSTDADNKVISAEAFYTLEYKIASLNLNAGKPGSWVGGTLSFAAASTNVNKVKLELLSQQTTSASGTISTHLINGEHVSGISPPSDATWEWDGSTLTSFGFLGSTTSIGGSQFAVTIISDQITDLSIMTDGTPGGTATATEYACVEGTFLASVGANGCGGYEFGANFIDESTTVWGPGLAVSQSINGDDISTVGPRTISAFDFGVDGIVGIDGMTPGDRVLIGNGIPQGSANATTLTFRVRNIQAIDDSASTLRNVPVTIDVLANDANFGNPATVTIQSVPTNGVAVVNGSPGNQVDIDITYTPAIGFAGVNTFEYTINDGANIDTAMVTVIVEAPVVNPDDAVTSLDASIEIDVLENDGGFADPMTVSVTVEPDHGTAVVTGSPGNRASIRITYTPFSGFSGNDSFEYQVSDGVNAETAVVSITVQPFAARDDDFTVLNTFASQLFVVRNDIGFADPVTVILTGFPDKGFAHIDGSSNQDFVSIHYFPVSNQGEYTTTMTYQVSDGTNTGSATVVVRAVPFAAQDDTATTGAGVPVTVNIVANDIGFGSSRIVELFSNPQHGTVVVNDSGSSNPTTTYTPAPGFLGIDTFLYAIDDGTNIDTAMVTVHVIVDADGDTVNDAVDNCLGAANTDQTDVDGDGYGNWCDADYNNNGIVNFGDLAIFRTNFAGNDAVIDLNSDGIVNFGDLARFRALFGKPPGPSALVP